MIASLEGGDLESLRGAMVDNEAGFRKIRQQLGLRERLPIISPADDQRNHVGVGLQRQVNEPARMITALVCVDYGVIRGNDLCDQVGKLVVFSTQISRKSIEGTRRVRF